MDRPHETVHSPAVPVYCTCLFLLCSIPAFASDGNKWQAGISYGISELDFHDSQAARIDNRGTYLKLLGDYVVNKHFAIEYGYFDYGSFSAHYSNNDEKISVDGYALTASAIGKAEIAARVRLMGKIGLDYWSEDVNVDFNFGNRTQHAADHGSDISSLFGVGLEYDISKDLLVRMEVEKYKGIDFDVELVTNRLDPIELSGKDVNTIGVAFLYAF